MGAEAEVDGQGAVDGAQLACGEVGDPAVEAPQPVGGRRAPRDLADSAVHRLPVISRTFGRTSTR